MIWSSCRSLLFQSQAFSKKLTPRPTSSSTTSSSAVAFLDSRSVGRIRPEVARQRRLSTSHPNPYDVLGCDRSATLDEVKAAFVKRAKRLHPDTAAAAGEDETNTTDSTESFIQCRQALEQIRDSLKKSSNNSSTRDTNDPDWRDNEEFEDWFYDATGADWLGFVMQDAAREEVNELYEFASKGLMRGWEVEMANFPKDAIKARPKKLASGVEASTEPQRRRRRR